MHREKSGKKKEIMKPYKKTEWKIKIEKQIKVIRIYSKK
jgi:hypothetical protein